MLDVFEGSWSAVGPYGSSVLLEPSSVNNDQSLVSDAEIAPQASLPSNRQSYAGMTAALVPDVRKDSTPSTNTQRSRGRSNGRKFDSSRDQTCF